MKGVLVYQPKSCYGTHFGNAAWAQALDLDIAEPVLDDGTAMTSFMGKMWMEKYLQGTGPHLVGSYYRGSVLPRAFSKRLRLCSPKDGQLRDIREYDYVVISMFWFHSTYASFLRRILPDIPLIGIEEYGFDDMLFFDEQALSRFYEAMRSLDLMICYTTPSYEHVGQLCANTHLLPFPMPLDYCRVLHRANTSIASACVGVSHFVSDQSNLYSSCIVARQIPEVQNSSCAVELIGVHDYKRSATEPLQGILPQLEITGWIATDFVQELSRFDILLQPTTRRSFGRLSADCALAGVPCISSRGCYMQDYCWPALAVEPHDIPSMVALWKRLSEDRAFCGDVVRYAQNKVCEYSRLWDSKARQLASLIEPLLARNGR